MSKEEIHEPRRNALKGGLALGGYAATAGMPFWSELALAQGEELVPFSDMPEGYAAPPKAPGGGYWQNTSLIDSFYTPNDRFYVVQHYGQPEIPESEFELTITGLVDRELRFSLADLKQRDKVEVDAGFECGGNRGAGIFQGLIGNARWGGVRLRELLQEAGLKQNGIEVVFYGADIGVENVRETDVEVAFGRSMHFEDALDADAILAYEMNGEPLPLFHM
jgi:DMSO/TMAO reductase YedYZ molybdopterin-dependent catalytic subunit